MLIRTSLAVFAAGFAVPNRGDAAAQGQSVTVKLRTTLPFTEFTIVNPGHLGVSFAASPR